jgi:hypothetical protein
MIKKVRTNLLAPFGMFLVLISCNNSTDFSRRMNPAAGYNERVEKAVKALPLDVHEKRDTLIAALRKTDTYKKLVTDETVSAEYLPVLTTIGIAVSMFDKETKTSNFSEIYYRTTKLGWHSDDEMEFQNCNYRIGVTGGLTPAIVEVYYRYRKKFGYFGDSTMTYVNEQGKNEPFRTPYNIAMPIAMFEPNNKEVLEALYKSMDNKYFIWQDAKNYLPKNSEFPYIAFSKSFQEHLKLVAPDSKYNLAKYIQIGQPVSAGHFEVTADDFTLTNFVDTGNPYMNLKATDGNMFLIIKATYKNVDQEGRTIFSAGAAFIDYCGKEYKFDKTQTVMADGFGVTLEALNPLSKKTTYLIYPISDEFRGNVFWQPADCNERIYLGTIK